MPRTEKCYECGGPMRRTGFEQKERGETAFYYQCAKCGHRTTRTIRRAKK